MATLVTGPDNDNAYSASLQKTLPELQRNTNNAGENITEDILERAWAMGVLLGQLLHHIW
jgi:hypothetical protein